MNHHSNTMENKQNYVAYLRRSKKEVISTLGIEAQMAEVDRYVKAHNGIIVETYTELESGTSSKLSRRIAIWRAIEDCKKHNAILIIAKLDRLARDVEFTSRLMNAGIRFIACDIPQANEFTIHVMAAVAEQEAKRISERTIAALRAKKARGEKLGYNAHKHMRNCITPEARAKAVAIIREKKNTNVNSKMARNYAYNLNKEGKSYYQIAEIMNSEGFKSPHNKTISPMTVKRWIDQAKEIEMFNLEVKENSFENIQFKPKNQSV